MLVQRRLAAHIRELIKYYPVVSLTGPRQAGKTTLLSQLFPDYQYVSLEAPRYRDEAMEDTEGFIRRYDRGIIFDEAQRVPPLFNYLQGIVDEDRSPGRFILSGSQNFLLHRGITQSLAGRVGIARLFPFDLLELEAADALPASPAEAILRGFYPNALTTNIPTKFFYPDYVSSYLERDAGEFINAGNLSSFQRFLSACAFFSGQLLNLQQLAAMTQVSTKTVNSWLSILESSYIIFRLGPYFNNFGKRLIKSPKLYFYDTGLMCYLLQATSEEDLRATNKYGTAFENLVIAERMKALYHGGSLPRLSYFRDSNGLEADLVEGGVANLTFTEIRSSASYSPKWTKSILQIGQLADSIPNYRVVYGGNDPTHTSAGTEIRPWYQAGQP